jgi:hypothetical protein
MARISLRVRTLRRIAEIVGQENVIAWAKLRVPREGAAITSKKLWS